MIRRVFTVCLLLAGEVGSLILALRVPTGSLDQIRSLPPEDAVLAAVRLVALAVACWLTASTVLYAVASATRIPALIRGVRWVTLPGVRRVLDGLVATTVVATSTLAVPGIASAGTGSPAAGGATTATPAPPYKPHPAGDRTTAQPWPRPGASTKSGYEPQPAGDPDPVPMSLEARHRAPPPIPAPTPATYVVRPGDHLWSVAARQVAEHSGKQVNDLSARDIGRYWVRLVDMNRPRLRSGDPDVVYPGETIVLPGPVSG